MILAHLDRKSSPTFFFAELGPWQVARSRCRYVSDGFDLDLAYATWTWRCSDCDIGGTWWNEFSRFFFSSKVTSKIIAMGFPGRGSGACFRNPQKEASSGGGNMDET